MGGSKIHPLPLTTPPLFSIVMMLSKSSVLMGVMQKFHKQSKENRWDYNDVVIIGVVYFLLEKSLIQIANQNGSKFLYLQIN